MRFEVHTNIHVVDMHVGQCDPVCGALASGYLEVSGDVGSPAGVDLSSSAL